MTLPCSFGIVELSHGRLKSRVVDLYHETGHRATVRFIHPMNAWAVLIPDTGFPHWRTIFGNFGSLDEARYAAYEMVTPIPAF